MKIAIQGHPTRAKEVIQILESLGGKKLYYSNAFDKYLVFFIDDKGYISCFHHESPLVKDCFKIYTLEEFEKEFPFKIGDKVSIAGVGHSIIALEYFNNKLCYKLDNRLHYSSETIKLYNKMKEERNVTLTLDKAREWYNKGGELKEIALQAFSEKELSPFPRSWDEFCKQGNPVASWRYNMPIKYEALFKLEQLRDCWRQGNIPQGDKYKIRKVGSKYKVVYGVEDAFLSFCDQQTAEEFLECFRDLIEKAGDLI